MSESSRHERTEKPTEKRRSDAARKGSVARSRELAGAAALLVAMAWLLNAFSGDWGAELSAYAVAPLRDALIWECGDLLAATRAMLVSGFQLIVPPVVVAPLAFVAASLVQAKPILTAEPLAFDPSRLNPMKNLGNALAPRRALGLIAWGHLKVGALVFAAIWATASSWGALMALPLGGVDDLVPRVAAAIAPAAKLVMAVGIALAVGDLAVKRVQHEASLRMTKREVRDEVEDAEQDPLIKGRLRSLMRALVRRRMLAEVRTATVVITNPSHYAVALRYRASEDSAPVVVAKGKDHLAARIRREAAKAAIPTVPSPPLARSLYAEVAIGAPIAESHYAEVAAILVAMLRDARERGQS